MLFWLYTFPMMLCLVQGLAMLMQPYNINAMRTRELYEILDFIWKELGLKTWNVFLPICVVLVAVLPVVNFWGYVIATGVDVSRWFYALKSWAKDRRFERYGSERIKTPTY